MFTDDLDMEIETKIETHKELFSDLTYNTNIETDFSETINTDTLKSTIEDIMKRHNADKKVDREMEELRDEMQRLQRIDREYANSKDNKDHTYLYKTGSKPDDNTNSGNSGNQGNTGGSETGGSNSGGQNNNGNIVK